MRLKGVTPLLYVPDLDAAIAFYRDVLGFSVLNRAGGWAALARDGAALMLSVPPDSEGGSAVEPRFTGSLYFYDDDVDATYAALRERVPIVYDLEDFAWGREFACRDPHGYVLQFGRELTGAT